jgi:hypothetical protein
VLVLFVLFEPMGLYGRWLKVRTWFQLFPFYRKGMFKRQKAFHEVGAAEMSAAWHPRPPARCCRPRPAACASAACWRSTA